MDNFFEQLKRFAHDLMWKRDRKAEVRVNLMRFIEAREAMRERAAVPARAAGLTWRTYAFRFAAILGVFALAGSGTAFASERTLPGDALYPVKILSEEVRSALALSPEAKANWEEERAERRLEEAAKLAAEGKLDDETKSELEDKFAKHSEKVKEELAKLQSKAEFAAAEGLASQFEAALDAHNRILSRLEDKEDRPRVASLNRSVEKNRDDVQSIRAAAETKVEDSEKSDEVKAAAQSRIAQASSSIGEALVAGAAAAQHEEDSVAPQAARESAPSFGAAAAKLAAPAELKASSIDEALRFWQDAQGRLDAGDYKEAMKSANKAIRKAKEAKVIRKAEQNLNIKLDAKEDDSKPEVEIEREHGSGRGR